MTAAAELNIEEWKDARLEREALKPGCERDACMAHRGFVPAALALGRC
jgi:hypothetical protein